MDNITKLYWKLHPGQKFNFYKLAGFRAGYSGKSANFNNVENLPDALVKDYETSHKDGREAKLGLK